MNYLFTTFEDYIRGTLSDQEQLELENLFETDKTVMKDFQLFKSMRTQLSKKFNSAKQSQELLQSLSSLGEKYFVENEENSNLGFARKSFRPFVMRIAASLLFLCAVGFGLKQYAATSYSGSGVATEMTPLGTEDDTTRSGSESTELMPGLKEYRDGKYKEAILTMDGIGEESIHYNDKFMFLGEAYLETGAYENAITQFTYALDKGEMNYAKWNLSRALLLNGDTEQAKIYLNDLVDGDDKRLAQNSQKVLDKLSGFMHWFASF